MNYIQEIEVTTDLVAEPVAVTEAKAWMKINFDTDDLIIDDLIVTARKILEGFTGLSFGSKTITAYMCIENKWLDLPYGPVNAITSITRIDGIGSTDVLVAGSDYELVGRRVIMNQSGEFKIIYTTAFTVPESLRTDIKKLVAYMYQNRGIQFESEDAIKMFPEWNSLSAHYYAKVVI